MGIGISVLRSVARGALCVPLLAVGQSAAIAAEAYPSRPIRMVVPYTPGGNTDVLARLIAQRLGQAWGQQVVVDNRAGGNTLIGTELVARAASDGYTIMFTTLTFAVTPSIYRKLPFDPAADFTPITLAVTLPNVLVVHPALPGRTLPEFIQHAKANPGKLSYASTGSGTSPHLSMEQLKTMAGIDLIHIPYKGGAPALADLIGGQIAAQFIGLPVALPHIRGNRLRALATTGAKRSTVAPDVPTVGETLAGYELDPWFGVFGPRNLPPALAGQLQREIARILRSPEMKDHLASMGAEAVGSTPAEFAAHVRSEIGKYAQIVRSAGVRVD
jgi:tripartite-type tricarboxylate transporter receptor subunit TctC